VTAPRPSEPAPPRPARAPARHRPAARYRDDNPALDAYIQEIVDNAPPLTSEQRDKLALLLHRHHRTR